MPDCPDGRTDGWMDGWALGCRSWPSESFSRASAWDIAGGFFNAKQLRNLSHPQASGWWFGVFDSLMNQQPSMSIKQQVKRKHQTPCHLANGKCLTSSCESCAALLPSPFLKAMAVHKHAPAPTVPCFLALLVSYTCSWPVCFAFLAKILCSFDVAHLCTVALACTSATKNSQCFASSPTFRLGPAFLKFVSSGGAIQLAAQRHAPKERLLLGGSDK